jgi:predicted anti-sigma-YlaC factor YlaD
MEHASLQADIEVSTSSISLGFVLPYLRVCIGIRNWHNRVGIWLSDTTRRKPAIPRIELTKEELQALEAHNRELGVLARVPSRLK